MHDLQRLFLVSDQLSWWCEQLLCGTEASYPSDPINQLVSVSDNCTCMYSNGFYHERTVGPEEVAPDVAFCFNAGVHGYTSWLQTMLLLRYRLQL